MADQSGQSSALTISDELRAQFPDLIDLIVKSESMNDEERQYWVNILPIMTPEQIDNLREILESERKQLEEIDQKYSAQVDTDAAKEDVLKTEEEIRKRREERIEVEMSSEKAEEEKTQDLLSKIEEL